MIITDATIDDPIAPIERVMEAVPPEGFLVQVRMAGWTGTGGGRAIRANGARYPGEMFATERLLFEPTGAGDGDATPASVRPRISPARLVLNSAHPTSMSAGVHARSSDPLPPPRGDLPERLCGRSCHTVDDVIAASEAGYDYVTLSPIATVPGKGEPLGVDGFARMIRDIRAAGAAVPILALGGVTPDLAPALRQAGAHGVAVIRAISRADDPGAVARAFVHAFD